MREPVDVVGSDNVIQTMQAYGIGKVVIEFSGGNDSGGSDRITFYNEAGDEMDRPADDPAHLVRWNTLLDWLEAPLYAQFGSFCGEFSVVGELVWDVRVGRPIMTGQESVETWKEFYY